MTNGNTNELHGALLGANALNPWHQHTTSPRGAMFANHLGQMLVINGATERNFQTGYEREYAKYTFKIEMPCNALILEIIERYKQTLGRDSIEHNPQTIVIYEDVDTKEIGMLSLQTYCSNHQYFGFRYKVCEGFNWLRVGETIPKGTVFLNSPSVTEEGGYKFGLKANIAYMTIPATSEDGVLISRDLLPKLGFRTYESRVVEWGNKKFALNLYGDKDNYKPFPDIGDVVRGDGILMALRNYGPAELAIVEQSVLDTMEVDTTFDTTVYANGPGGRVVDIKIHHDIKNINCAEVHMDAQAQKYDAARRQFYKRIVDSWKKLYAKRGDALQITPEFSRMVVEARSVESEGQGQSVSKLYRKAPLDDYRVEFVIEYDIDPSIGFKITDCHGGKGVLCQIAEPEDMPIDAEGNRADIVMDPNSTIGRMNLGRLYEQYESGASRDTHKRLCSLLQQTPGTHAEHALMEMQGLSQPTIDHAWEILMGLYKIISPGMHAWFAEGKVDQAPIEYLADIVEKGITIWLPTDNPPESEDIIMQLESNDMYRPCYSPVSYVGNSGRRVTTKDKVRIASMYFILLEKIGDDWSAVSSGKLQHFGVLSQLTKTDKYSKPARNQAVRGAGEAEVRIFISYIGSRFMAEMMDRNNSPQTHKEIVSRILSAPFPSNIDNLIDRSAHPYGGSKPVQLVQHLAECSGFRFKFQPYVSTSLHISKPAVTVI